MCLGCSTGNRVEIYTRQKVSKELAAKAEGWNREHLWPRSYGLADKTPEFSDLHNLRPADVNVNSSRGNKYFGECSLPGDATCLVPANREAAPDTAANRVLWQPPAEARGDIARALMYMAVRYEGPPSDSSMDLELSDSPVAGQGRMGLLSTLMRWHEADPPSASEKLRNERVCSLFQHNRNPFVDHPEYAPLIWGSPQLATGASSNITLPPPVQGGTPQAAALPGVNQLPLAWINELHYDNKGVDQAEFVEVVVGPKVDPAALTVYLYNGSDGKVYKQLPLSNFSRGQQTKSGMKVLAALLPQGSLQNGPADGLALVYKDPFSSSTLQLLQFLSYEGSLRASDGPAKDRESLDIGVEESDDSSVDGSLGLVGSGRSYGDFTWSKLASSSFGRLNNGQDVGL
eukprot:jgi/Mesen1/3542/ME000198S02741